MIHGVMLDIDHSVRYGLGYYTNLTVNTPHQSISNITLFVTVLKEFATSVIK
jgi:hypothetical protein